MSKWQDISTAPKDGTEILLSTTMLNRPVVGRWTPGLDLWSAVYDVHARGTVRIDSYTHWQPILLPQAQGESEEERSDDTATTEERIASLTQQLESLRASLANEKEAREKAEALAEFFETELSRILQEGAKR
jgi:hypothetical protein